jgi:Clp amino terminal domain, pathogenicity island component
MFERYTEEARRAIFFARYEASRYGSQRIEAEHLLLGLFRENYGERLGEQAEWFREQIEKNITIRDRIPTTVEIPLSDDSKKALNFAHQEADVLKSRYIGPEHILAGIFHVDNSLAARLLRERGVTLNELRTELASSAPTENAAEDGRVLKWSERAEELLHRFLGALRSEGSGTRLGDFFADDARVIDSHGQMWVGVQEIDAHGDELFSPYAMKRASYRVEDTRIVRTPFLHATVLWQAPGSGLTAPTSQRMTLLIVQTTYDVWEVYFTQITNVT